MGCKTESKQETISWTQSIGKWLPEGKVEGGFKYMVMEGERLCGEHAMQHTQNVLQNFTLETCVALLTNVTPNFNNIKSVSLLKKKKKSTSTE